MEILSQVTNGNAGDSIPESIEPVSIIDVATLAESSFKAVEKLRSRQTGQLAYPREELLHIAAGFFVAHSPSASSAESITWTKPL